MGNRVFNRKEVEAAIPKARLLAAIRLGLPIQYSELDLINAFYNYINGYNVDPIDKELMLSLDNIKWALNYLNSFGHNLKNLDYVVLGMYNAPRNNRQRDALQRNSEKNKNNREDGYSGLGKNLLKFATGVVDVPRRALASLLHHGTEDGRYDAGLILNVMDERPTPLTGLEFAQEHPLASATVDIVTPMALGSLVSSGINAARNAVSYAGRKGLLGFQKSKALQQMQSGNVPAGTEYEVVRTLKPINTKSGTTYQYEWGKSGGSKLTGTQSPATGTPYTRGSNVNGFNISSLQVVTPGYKAVNDVYTWASYPWVPFLIPGVPLFISSTLSPQLASVLSVPQHTIVEEDPGSYDDSDIINALGALEGDIIHMPDGRVIRYIKGGDSRGTQHDYTTVREYDRHNRDVKQQPNVPDRTRVENKKGNGKKVSVEQRRNPEYMYRDYNNYYPEIVPINNGKSNR